MMISVEFQFSDNASSNYYEETEIERVASATLSRFFLLLVPQYNKIKESEGPTNEWH